MTLHRNLPLIDLINMFNLYLLLDLVELNDLWPMVMKFGLEKYGPRIVFSSTYSIFSLLLAIIRNI